MRRCCATEGHRRGAARLAGVVRAVPLHAARSVLSCPGSRHSCGMSACPHSRRPAADYDLALPAPHPPTRPPPATRTLLPPLPGGDVVHGGHCAGAAVLPGAARGGARRHPVVQRLHDRLLPLRPAGEAHDHAPPWLTRHTSAQPRPGPGLRLAGPLDCFVAALPPHASKAPRVLGQPHTAAHTHPPRTLLLLAPRGASRPAGSKPPGLDARHVRQPLALPPLCPPPSSPPPPTALPHPGRVPLPLCPVPCCRCSSVCAARSWWARTRSAPARGSWAGSRTWAQPTRVRARARCARVWGGAVLCGWLVCVRGGGGGGVVLPGWLVGLYGCVRARAGV